MHGVPHVPTTTHPSSRPTARAATTSVRRSMVSTPARRVVSTVTALTRPGIGRRERVLVVPCATCGTASSGSRLVHRLPQDARFRGRRRAGVHPVPRREDRRWPRIRCRPTRSARAATRRMRPLRLRPRASVVTRTSRSSTEGREPASPATRRTATTPRSSPPRARAVTRRWPRFDTAAHAGGVACEGCHKPHHFAGLNPKTLCETCHARETTLVAANQGHADCTSCHGAEVAHAPASPPACGSCHVAEAKSAPAGHQRCEGCHDPHAGQPVPDLRHLSREQDRRPARDGPGRLRDVPSLPRSRWRRGSARVHDLPRSVLASRASRDRRTLQVFELPRVIARASARRPGDLHGQIATWTSVITSPARRSATGAMSSGDERAPQRADSNGPVDVERLAAQSR